MNDRFRFRVWNETEKKYLKMAESHCDNVGFFLSCMEDEVLEQCTGLKDKNGRLIYEGDILRLSAKYSQLYLNGDQEVEDCVYDELYAGFTPFCLYDSDCGIYEYPEDIEVIGNIHENPELLEHSKCEGGFILK